MVDDAKLHQFIGQMLSDLGGAASIALVRIGDSLGLYKQRLHRSGDRHDRIGHRATGRGYVLRRVAERSDVAIA